MKAILVFCRYSGPQRRRRHGAFRLSQRAITLGVRSTNERLDSSLTLPQMARRIILAVAEPKHADSPDWSPLSSVGTANLLCRS